MVEPVILDHQVEDARIERGVAARLDGQDQVAGPGEGSDSRVDIDDFRPVLAGLPDVAGGDRSTLGDIRQPDPDQVGEWDVRHRVAGPVDPERLLVSHPALTMQSRPL